jgi:hypothetical protein
MKSVPYVNSKGKCVAFFKRDNMTMGTVCLFLTPQALALFKKKIQTDVACPLLLSQLQKLRIT